MKGDIKAYYPEFFWRIISHTDVPARIPGLSSALHGAASQALADAGPSPGADNDTLYGFPEQIVR